MIRMGRGAVKDSGEQPAYQEQQSSIYQYTSETQPASTRAVSESESMARDIKEGRLSGYVGNGTVLTGETNFQAMLRVDGHLTGRITSDNGTLIIGSTGRVDANIAVAAAVIAGTVNGDIVATERLELSRTARVVGNVQSPRLVIEDGALFEGGCTMVKSKEALEKRNAAAQAPVYEEPVAEADADVEDDEEAAEAAAV